MVGSFRASIVVIVVAGCSSPPASPPPEPAPAAAPVAAAAHDPGPGDLLDARDEAGQSLRFRIDSVAPASEDPDGEVFLYGLSVEQEGAWTAYCSPDIAGRSVAVPVAGSWAGDGRYTPGDEITFACTSGAIGKCILFGYKPWKSVNGTSLAPYHAACVRMVRADYCGDGTPHTQDGTRIDIFDRLGIQRPDPEPGIPEVFEAAWAPEGAAYLATPRWSDDVAAVVAECPDTLKGRTPVGAPLTAEQAQARYPEALLFNARMRDDADKTRPLSAFPAPHSPQ